MLIAAFVQSWLVLYNYFSLCDYAIIYMLFSYRHLKGFQFLGIANNAAAITVMPVLGIGMDIFLSPTHIQLQKKT